MNNDSALLTNITEWLQRSVDGFRQVTSLQQLTAGASKQTFKLEVDTDSGKKNYALRCNGPENADGEQVAQILLETEAELFKLAAQHAIPVPQVLLVDAPSRQAAQPQLDGFLMDWFDGETLGHKIVRSPELNEVRKTLAHDCGEILGRIHQIDWQKAGLAERLPVVTPQQLVEETWSRYRAYGVAMPMIDYTWRWLKDNIPIGCRQTLVHGDFRNGNLMVGQHGIKAVLDWELAHIGNPIRDLGWLCVNSWRFGVAEKEVGGFGTVSDLLAGYEKETGIRVATSELKFWQVFGSFWWATTTLLMANSWRTGANKSLERPAIGRRSSEAQMDCVNLLFPGEVILDIDELENHAAAQLPSSSELVASVSAFLRNEISNKLDAHDSFMAKVGANSLAIVERELAVGMHFSKDEQQGLQGVLNTKGTVHELRTQLAEQLRDGLSLNTSGLQDHLRNSVAKQLYIDQPNYSALKAALK